MKREEAVKALYELAKEIDFLENTIMTLSWDMRVNLPKQAGEYRGNTIGFLAGQVFERKTSPKLNEVLCVLEEEPAEDEVLAAMIRKFRREYKYLSEVPAELNAAYAAHNLKCEVVWQEARANNDYAMLMPWMEKEFDYLRQIAAAHGFADDVMTGLMQAGEPGLTRAKVDELFEELKTFELPFLEQLKSAPNKPYDKPYPGPFPAETQKAMIIEILTKIGYDFTRGRIDVSAHPYTTANDRNDIRFTTRYFEEDFTRALISSTHEGGHGLHAQNTSPKLRYTTLESMTYAALCESQSRYMENIIARSLPFWEFALPIVQKYFPQMKSLSPEQMYQSLNRLNFHASRLHADELTYNLHIIIRYELEKMLYDGDITFAELPHYWNEKYKEYLGITPKNDAEGLLQDMHWSSGYIGYFQSYVMGNFYDGHYYTAMKRDVPDFFDQVRRGEFSGVVGWLRDNIQQYGGMYTPAELMQKFGGGELTAKHYIDYIRDKYAQIYGV
ncbi:MAG: carboxypeptidase M32 [Lachnospiraceae bacterium]|nr:carboxypeptidase M32 [Lachnospiraceae bacterium]